MQTLGVDEMNEYRYEPHLHTAESSGCATSSGVEMAHHFKSLNYTGVFVTDHLFVNTGTRYKDTPWTTRVDLLCRGYDVMAQEGARIGLDVFLAWEYCHGWAHFLTYGLSKTWLCTNPDILSLSLTEYLDRVRESGGFIVHAHPFREGIDLIELSPFKVHAVEVMNACRTNESNRHASDFAESFGLPETAGSDIHRTSQDRLCGITCSERLTTGSDYASVITSGTAALFDTQDKKKIPNKATEGIGG